MEPSSLNTVTIVIPAFDAEATLGACLDAVAAQTAPPNTCVEVLVIDDGSTDATRTVAEQRRVRVLPGSGAGPAAARNLGAREARGGILVFLDADTRPEAGWLGELLKPLSDETVIAVKGAYSTDQRRVLPRFVQLEFEYKYARLERAPRVDFVDTGTAAFRRDAFLDVGGFDERFPANSAEDVDLAFRLSEQGARFVFNPHARVRHRHPERLRDYLLKKARYGFFRTDIYRRHPDKALGDSYTPPEMAAQIALAGAGVALTVPALKLAAARRSLLAVLLAFALSTLPLIRRARATDPPLTWGVPLLVLARALAQGCGIAAGLASMLVRRR